MKTLQDIKSFIKPICEAEGVRCPNVRYHRKPIFDNQPANTNIGTCHSDEITLRNDFFKLTDQDVASAIYPSFSEFWDWMPVQEYIVWHELWHWVSGMDDGPEFEATLVEFINKYN